MAKIFVRYAFTGINGVVVATWNDMGAPGAEIGRRVIDGVATPFNDGFTISGLAPVMHEVHFYESTDGATLSVPLMKLDIDAAITTEHSVQILHYKVGRGLEETDPALPYWRDPADGEETLIDERLTGATYENMTVHFQGVGDLNPEQFDILPSGGISLTDTQFSDGGYFSIRVHEAKQVVAEVEKVILREGINVIGGSETFAEKHHGKNNIAQFNTPIAYVTVGDFAAIPSGTYSIFSTYGMAGRYLSIRFETNAIFFMGRLRTEIILGQNERLVLAWQGGEGYALDYQGDYAYVGQKINGDRVYNNTYQITKNQDDGGHQEHLIEHFKRLIDEVPAEDKVSYADWDTFEGDQPYLGFVFYQYFKNRGKYAIDLDRGYFRFPALCEQYMKFTKPGYRGLENTRWQTGANALEANRVMKHSHEVRNGAGGNNTGTIVGVGFSGQDVRAEWVNDSELIHTTGGAKNLVDSFTQYLLIRI